MVKSGITREEVIAWGGADVFNQALRLVNSHGVTAVEYDDEALEIRGRIDQGTGWEMPVKLRLEPGGRIRSFCPCAENQRYGRVCLHVVALGIAQWVTEMDDEPPAAAEAEANQVAPPEEQFLEVEMRPRFSVYVQGSRASVSVELDAWYGEEISLPAGSVQAPHTVYLPDPDDPQVRRVRSLKAEREALARLQAEGFEPGYLKDDQRLHLVGSQPVLSFLGGGLPRLRRLGWHVELHERLTAMVEAMPSVVPVVEVRDGAGGDFDVRCTFDAQGREVPVAEVFAALHRGDGYLLRDGEVTLLDLSAVEAMRDVFEDCVEPGSGGEDGWFRVRGIHAPYVKASLERLDSVDLDDSRAERWRNEAARRNREGAEAKFEPVALGPLEQVLRPYQKQGVYWMRFLEESGYSGLLADEMGLGKTLQTLTWLSLPRTVRPTTARPALVVCPTSLVRNWEAEARKFLPDLRVLVISGPERARDFPRIADARLVITSYALLQRDFEAAYLGVEFAAVVLDEAQHIKNRGTRNAQAVKLLKAERRLVLTGTPVENSVADVWSIFDFLMPGYLNDYERFRLDYEQPIAEGGAAAEAAQDKLRRKLHPFILRRLKQTVAKDLPDKLVKVSYCPLPADVQAEYNAELLKGRGSAKTKFQMLALLMKLRQISSRGKLEALMELLDEAISGGHRVLVFSQFVRQLQAIAKALEAAGVKFCYLDGSTGDRLGAVNRFNADGSIPVFLISLMAGGTGLNLTGADMVIHYDPWWNPAVEDQATDRAHRIGQKKKVYVVKLIASDTVEEKVLELQRRKQAVIAATVSTSDEAIVSKLTESDLAGLLGLE